MLTVNSINCGIVIDHITAGNGIKIFEKLNGEVNFPWCLIMPQQAWQEDIIK